MRYRRRDRGDGMCHASNDRPMMVAADDPLDLPVTSDYGGECWRIAQVDAVHVGDAAGERRVMHADYRRLVGRRSQCAVEEFELLGTQFAMASSWHKRIQHQ